VLSPLLQTDPASLRGDLRDVIGGTFFVLIGLIAFSLAAMRRRSGIAMRVWLGVWSTLFGANALVHSQIVIAALPASWEPFRNLFVVATSYLILVAAMFAFLHLSLGWLRRLLQLWLAAAIAVAVAGIGRYIFRGSQDTFIVYNQLLASSGLVILLVVLAVPSISKRCLVVAQHRVLTIGTAAFVAVALFGNIARTLGYSVPDVVNFLGFSALLLSFGYVALQMTVSDERRLLSIDKELEIARELQFSILPEGVPEILGLRVAASYLPMTAVAGDFYEFVRIDEHRAGFLVADVSGHGVPAALIASMLNVAMHSVSSCADDPSEVLRRLGSTLFNERRGHFVSAAYLWIDTETRTARYSAAGHPPLLRWCAADDALIRIESNGLLFGVQADAPYPTCEVPLAAGDRLLLYTDGFTEPENAVEEAFGDRKLDQVIRQRQSLPAPQLADCLLSELRTWQSASQAQQDDITLIVIDVT
jgi:phosphoserine phosphatase RsbU/P